jgi:hypothetical protein
VILWLARKDDAADGDVWIRLAERRYEPRHRVEFSAGTRAAQTDAPAEVQYQAEVALPNGGTQKVNLVPQGDHVVGVFDQTVAAGDYAITVTARRQGAALGSAKARFLVYQQDLELDNAVADPTLLASLSAMTKDAGGQSFAPEELPDLLRRIQDKPADVQVETVVKHTPWDTWPFFLAFVGVVSAEWYLRKKWGLV